MASSGGRWLKVRGTETRSHRQHERHYNWLNRKNPQISTMSGLQSMEVRQVSLPCLSRLCNPQKAPIPTGKVKRHNGLRPHGLRNLPFRQVPQSRSYRSEHYDWRKFLKELA